MMGARGLRPPRAGYARLFALLRETAPAPGGSDGQLRRRLCDHWATYMTPAHIRLLPGLPDTLERARDAGLRLAVASSSDGAWVRRWLRHFALDHLFDAVVTGDDVTRRKPAPEPYLRARRRWAARRPAAWPWRTR